VRQLSKIAFRTEEAVESRTELRRRLKRKDYKFICPKCGHVEFGGSTATVIKNVDPITKKESVFRVHRKCPECGANMVRELVK
jgi:transcription elongation factor Elf1